MANAGLHMGKKRGVTRWKKKISPAFLVPKKCHQCNTLLHKFSLSPTPTAHPVQVVDKIFCAPRYSLCTSRWTTRFNCDHLKYFNGTGQTPKNKSMKPHWTQTINLEEGMIACAGVQSFGQSWSEKLGRNSTESFAVKSGWIGFVGWRKFWWWWLMRRGMKLGEMTERKSGRRWWKVVGRWIWRWRRRSVGGEEEGSFLACFLLA